MRRKVLHILVAALVLALCIPAGAVAPMYNVTDLGTLGGNYSFPHGVNCRGQVVGESTRPDDPYTYRAFLWNPGTGMTDLGTLGGADAIAWGINDSGMIVGGSATSSSPGHAFLWTPAGGMTDLGTLGGRGSWAYAINGAGLVVGTAIGARASSAFQWREGVGMSPVPGAPPYPSYSEAYAVNEIGDVAGSSDGDAVLWTNGQMTNLWAEGEADGVNDSLQVVGHGYASYLDINGEELRYSRAFLWQPGTGMIELGDFGGTHSSSSAEAINNAGQAVGSAEGPDGYLRAFVWESGVGLVDLNTRIGPTSGWYLGVATGISSNGFIVGSGLLNGEEHAFLLTPVPEPASVIGLITGLPYLLLTARRRRVIC